MKALHRTVYALCSVLSLLSLGLFLFTAVARLGYPYELEWLEGGVLVEVARATAGEPLYVEPSVDYIPFIYTPLYIWIGAALCKLFGLKFVVLRVISLASTLLCFALLFILVLRETRSAVASFLAVGLFCATYEISGVWFDIARVDSLFVALLLASLLLLKVSGGSRVDLAAGALLGLSFLTKQAALAMFPAFAAYLMFFHRSRAVPFSLGFAITALAVSAVMNLKSGGWYSYYVFELPSGFERSLNLDFFTVDLIGSVPFTMACAALYFFLRGPSAESKRFFAFALFAAGFISWFSKLHVGGYANDLIPLYLMLCAVAAMGVGHAARSSAILKLISAVMVLLQLAASIYDPRPYIPTAADARAGDRLAGLISGISGEVFIPSHPYLSLFAGKKSYAHTVALSDLLILGDSETTERIVRDLLADLATHRFSAVVWDGERSKFARVARAFYGNRLRIFSDDDVFWTRVGMRTRPQFIYCTDEAFEEIRRAASARP
ncbi:MAG TPA: hypothetical protein ENF73_06690 [Proteobacteria bacterium]|nr:hypothetical protein [Pseudomonadota bacterium]